MRQFKLKNANGSEFNLMRKDAFFWEPEGLGWGKEAETQRLEDAFLVTKALVTTPAPSGSIVFAGYSQYQEFLSFIQVGGLVLCYMPISNWRYLDCYAVLGKTEIKPDTGKLICDIAFQGVSEWYETVRSYQASGDLLSTSKKYSFEYPYTYADSTSGSVNISNSNLPSYFKITIMGYTLNPTYRLYVSGNVVASGRIVAEIQNGYKLVINSNPAKMEISQYTSAGVFVADLYGSSDFSTERLFKIPAGESTMVFTDESISTPNAYIEVMKFV